MKITILSHSETYYTTRRLMEAATSLNHEVDLLDPVTCSLAAGPGGLEVFSEGRPIELPDVVIPRIGATLTRWSLTLLESLVTGGARSSVSAQAIRACADKLETTRRLTAEGLPTLPTVVVREPAHIGWALDAVGGPPIVAKRQVGTQGRHVFQALDRPSAYSLLEAMVGDGTWALVQPLVALEVPRDLRILVVGGEPLAACWRYAAAGEFRSNLHRGGRVAAASLADGPAALAVRCAEVMGVHACGVDLIPTEASDGPAFRVLEVNASPGLEGIESVTQQDLAGAFIEAATGV